MNYRHGFHAGNVGDVFKHAVLVWALERLAAKPAPFAYIETHAGAGRYDLAGAEAAKTGEHRTGIARLLAAPAHPALERYRALAAAAAPIYPGSPALAQAILRPQDRLVLCEAHPEELQRLEAATAGDRRVELRQGDGWAQLKAVLPPRERRGLVLIDPPYEAPDELDRLADALVRAHRRWATGCYLAWYPVKHAAATARFLEAMSGSGIRRILEAAFDPDPGGTPGLIGSGLVLINPPWPAEEALPEIGRALTVALAYPRARFRSAWLVPE